MSKRLSAALFLACLLFSLPAPAAAQWRDPDQGDTSFKDQSRLYSVEWLQIMQGIAGDGVLTSNGTLSGCAATPQGSPDMTVAISSCTVIIGGSAVAVSSGNVTVTAAHATLPRIDLVVVNNAGTKAVTAGTPALANQALEPPATPANAIVLAEVYVPATDTTIDAAQIVDKRVPAVQSWDAELKALAGLTSAADKLPYFTGSATAGVADFSAYARTFLDDANEAALKATLNLEANTDFYAPGGTDVALADGGTGASLVDPNADRIAFWDDSAGAVTWLTAGDGLTITTTTISSFFGDSFDACAELAAILDDETGTCGGAVLSNSPTFDDDVTLGAAGVRLTGADGGLTILGLGNGADEDLAIDLDNGGANVGTVSSSTSLATLNFSSIALQESGVGVLNADEIDGSAELIALVDDESGTGALLFGTSPTIATPTISGAIVFPDNARQTFNPGANATGLNVGAQDTDPDTPVDGDLFYDGNDELLRARINGAWVNLGAGGAFDATAVDAVTWSDGANASNVWTFDVSGTDTTLTLGNNNWIIGATSVDLGAAGVRISHDGDGAITFLGLGNGDDEDLTLNLDDVANVGTFTSSTSLAVLNFSSIALQESGIGVLNNDEIDASAELLAIMDDETGTGALVFGNSPTFTDDFDLMATGVRFSAADGVLTLTGLGNGSDENLTLDLDNGVEGDELTFDSSTDVWKITWLFQEFSLQGTLPEAGVQLVIHNLSEAASENPAGLSIATWGDDNTGSASITLGAHYSGDDETYATIALDGSAGAGAPTLRITTPGPLEFDGGVTPASSGTRFLCISTAGVVQSSASACSGT